MNIKLIGYIPLAIQGAFVGILTSEIFAFQENLVAGLSIILLNSILMVAYGALQYLQGKEEGANE